VKRPPARLLTNRWHQPEVFDALGHIEETGPRAVSDRDGDASPVSKERRLHDVSSPRGRRPEHEKIAMALTVTLDPA